MVEGLNHIGICVKSIEPVLELLRKTMNAEEVARYTMPERNQVSCMVRIGKSGEILELMEPMGDTGTVADFLAKHGEGLHHISLKTENLEETIVSFEKSGCRIVGHSGDFAFVHPKTSFGVLYEIAQMKGEG